MKTAALWALIFAITWAEVVIQATLSAVAAVPLSGDGNVNIVGDGCDTEAIDAGMTVLQITVEPSLTTTSVPTVVSVF